MTVSTDGRVLWWDMRHLSEPSDELFLQNKGSDERLGAISLEYNPAVGPTRFMVGTEEGCILSCNRAKGQGDRTSAIFDGQQGGICGVERSPFHPKYFVTCGDWTTRMWNEDLRTPISGTPSQQARLASICWSTTRPGVYFTARADGLVDSWDILLKGHRAPSLTYQVASDQLNVIRSHANGRLLATGGANGKTCILGVGDALAEALPQEKGLLVQTLEGETLQEKNLEKAQKEAKVQEDFREALGLT
ncbi:hypothetical protein CVIRNUC_010132 [Coccomyxa viridis]|uniref:Uncharacterized protein n=1 Tax=Coccomyxa viridis TaxID=1274662 RepID=A0AAV1IHU1_9CHLO|nr:hypothetical protein CVIRNUC_010132 [Coccomyxa viridis]